MGKQPVNSEQGKGGGFKLVPIRFLLPNMLTLLALCSGITAIRLAIEGQFQFAVAGIIFAIVLDATDGRLARILNGTSRFGAELDSLADTVNFGVAPAIILYLWSLSGLKTLGWAICLLFAIACTLRLARFNVALDEPQKPAWASRFFVGMPAPGGAILVLAPLYLDFLGLLSGGHTIARLTAPYTAAIAIMMVSRVPTFSGKSIVAVKREYVLPLLAGMVMFVVLLISYPWETLAVIAFSYLASLPFSVYAYRQMGRKQTVV